MEYFVTISHQQCGQMQTTCQQFYENMTVLQCPESKAQEIR